MIAAQLLLQLLPNQLPRTTNQVWKQSFSQLAKKLCRDHARRKIWICAHTHLKLRLKVVISCYLCPQVSLLIAWRQLPSKCGFTFDVCMDRLSVYIVSGIIGRRDCVLHCHSFHCVCDVESYFRYTIFVISGKAPISSRNLWISGLASSTRATDLKTLFTKYGKVCYN